MKITLPGAGFLTRLADEPAHAIPYPPFEPLEIKIFEKFMRYVWKATRTLEKLHGVNFSDDEEEAISFAVATVIELLTAKSAEEFSWFLDVFQFEGLAAKRPNFARTSIRQQCDFAFRRAATVSGRLRHLDCLFVEAKVVSPKHLMGYYAKTGIRRFIEASYAYAMPQAVLLGYVRDTDQKLPDSLEEHFRRDGGNRAVELEVDEWPQAVASSRAGVRMHWTKHKRALPNVVAGPVPGPIVLFHLWLHVASDR